MTRQIAAALFGILAVAAPVSAQLTHHYTFDIGVVDLVGGSDGTMIGGAVGGGLLTLDGVDDFVQFDDFIVPTSGPFSVAIRARGFDTGVIAEMISQGSSGSAFYMGFYGSVFNNGNAFRAGDVWSTVSGTSFPLDGEFHHFAFTYDGGSLARLFLDGGLIASTSATYTMGAIGTPTRFGRQYSTHGEFFEGSLDEVRIYNDDLSAEQIAELAETTTATPEPLSMLLLGSGLAGVGAARRRRRVA